MRRARQLSRAPAAPATRAVVGRGTAHTPVCLGACRAVLPLFPIPLVSRVQQRAARPRWLVAGA